MPFVGVPERASSEREQLMQVVRHHEGLAEQAAGQGDVTLAAREILAALDAERRMAAKGPQVLQLIKPRA